MTNGQRSKSDFQMPWFTWILPLFIFHLGTQVSLKFQITQGVALWYLPLPLAFVLIQWWGPRVLLGLYLNAVFCAGMWGLTKWQFWPLYALPEVVSTYISWLLFNRLAGGKCWLPDLNQTLKYFILALFIPLTVSAFYVVGQLVLLGDLQPEDFWWTVLSAWIADIFGGLAFGTPILLFFTASMERLGLSQTSGATKPQLLEKPRSYSHSKMEILVIFSLLLIVSLFIPFEKFWYIYGIFPLWSALRFGVGMAVLTNTWTAILTLLLPAIISSDFGASWTPETSLLNVHLGMVLIFFAALTVGRSISDNIVEIKERKHSEEKFHESENRFRHLVETAPTIILTFSPEFKVQEFNSEAEVILGYQRKEVLGKYFDQLFIREHFRQAWVADIKMVLSGESIRNQESTILDKEGKEHIIVWNINRLLDPNQNLVGIILVGLDVTSQRISEQEQLQLKERLQHTQKMEAIGTLAGGIAHDFNNILSAILGYSEKAKLNSKNPNLVREDLDNVMASAVRARELVKQILSFSRQKDTELTMVNPSILVNEVLEMLRSSLPSTIEIHADIDPNSDVILADPTQIHQIIFNLCTNAYQAMEKKGGKLLISLQNSKHYSNDFPAEDEPLNGNYVQLSVKDTGHGIAPEIVSKIFEPYYTTKQVGDGTGLGLSIVHSIVSSYNGKIEVQTEVGEGTTFQIFLPAVKNQIDPESDSTQALPRGDERILFVDDEESLVKLGKDILGELGYNVTSKQNSTIALELFNSQPDMFDLVITDQTMPGVTGIELAKQILKTRQDIPIILCTGYSASVTEEEVKSLGIKELMIKPIMFADMAKLIRKTLDHKA